MLVSEASWEYFPAQRKDCHQLMIASSRRGDTYSSSARGFRKDFERLFLHTVAFAENYSNTPCFQYTCALQSLMRTMGLALF